ncbi:MAG TPA: GNAT family N-acetyltransferase [Nitrosopumilaceae archaeon]|nr:GNAT family N-acetyltransferase [Nitrosopumilaceae archaeon]
MTDVKIREIEKSDLEKGFLESLDSLRKASDLDLEKAIEVLKNIKSNPNHKIFVAVVDDRIIGSTTLLIEPKFIHKAGHVGHIEDVVVSKNFQGRGVGEKLIKASLDFAKNKGCYKTILDCSDDVKPFYEKIGFKKHSNSMRFNHV